MFVRLIVFLSILSKHTPKGGVFLIYSQYDFVDSNAENSKRACSKVFIIVGLVNKLQMREYLVHFCGHFFSIDPLSSRAKIDNADHVKYCKNAVPNIHKI